MENQNKTESEIAAVIKSESRRWLRFAIIALILYSLASNWDDIKQGWQVGYNDHSIQTSQPVK